ncbi:MAG: ABC transporter substrate-binding protein [Burkholderiales bacterium]
MNRRAFTVAIAAGVAGLAQAAAAQGPARAARVGVIVNGRELGVQHEAFLRGLTDLGYVAGQNLVVETRLTDGQPDRLPAIADELVRLPVDVIVVAGPAPVETARRATRTIPIVMIAGSADPVGEGIAASLARPGGNVTGLTYAVSPERFGKQLEFLKALAPKVARVAVWWDFGLPLYHDVWAAPLKAAADSLRLEITGPVQVLGVQGMDAAFAAFRQQRADAVLVVMGGPTFGFRDRVAAQAVRERLPTVAAFREYVVAGGLVSYGPNLPDLYRRGATFVDRILKGAKPGDLPIELPTNYELAINLGTARALGLTVPSGVLARADEVIR